TLLARQPAGDLGGRPSHRKAVENALLQVRLARQPGSAPAALLGLLMSIRGLVAQLAAAVAFQLARYRRCRAIQSCRDFLVRLPSGMPLGNRTPLVQRELLVMIPHRNTSYTGCCTSFVNPRGPIPPRDGFTRRNAYLDIMGPGFRRRLSPG